MKKTSENWLQSPHLAEIKLVYQPKQDLSSAPLLDSPDKVYQYLLNIWDLDRIELQEEFCIVLFNNSMRALGWHRLSTGGKTATIVDPAIVISFALLGNASSIILAHNHPSEYMKASTADIQLTSRIHKGLQILGIRLHDHLIISRNQYLSFNQKGLLP